MRKEKDSMGEMEVPDNALYGASTQRAVINFPISGRGLSPTFIRTLAAIKVAAAQANQELGLLESKIGAAIEKVAQDIWQGRHLEQFVVDIFQTGSGTSTNMNANEVIAHQAQALLKSGEKVHPNDHVNMCQSSNDVIPTAIHVAAVLSIRGKLFPALERLKAELMAKEAQFSEVIKSGRTHLQDATPVTLGQEFGGYAHQIALARTRLVHAVEEISTVTLGGTAVGTGINTHEKFAELALRRLSELTGVVFKKTENHFALQGGQEGPVAVSGGLKALACALMKIANDIRWLSSGPRCGIGELMLPAVQPGSSIMPAKVNPVIAESLMMVCAQVMGNDACITVAGHHGNFELNVMLPVIAHNLLESIDLLAAGTDNFTQRCITGLEPVVSKCRENAEKSLALCTSLAPKIGYEAAAKIAKSALERNLTVAEVAEEMAGMSHEEIKKLLDLFAMTQPGL